MGVNQDRIRGLDGLRGVAVLGVLFSHKLAVPSVLGGLGVWLFFVLSGFLIVRILAKTRAEIEAGASAPAAVGGFFWRRAARLLPIYYLVLTLCVLASATGGALAHFGPAEQPYYWLHGANFLVAEKDFWIERFGHLWSLAVEEQFYLLAAPLLLLCPRKHSLLACWAIVAIGTCFKLALWTTQPSDIRSYVDVPTNFAMLAFGGVIGLLADKTLPRWLHSGAAQAATLGAFIGAPFAMTALGADVDFFGQFTVVIAGLLLVQIFQSQETEFVTLLESAPLRQIGLISYGLYLYHPFILLSAPPGYERFAPVAEIALSLAAAAISWRFIEMPIRRWAGRVRWRRPAVQTAPA